MGLDGGVFKIQERDIFCTYWKLRGCSLTLWWNRASPAPAPLQGVPLVWGAAGRQNPGEEAELVVRIWAPARPSLVRSGFGLGEPGCTSL